MTNFKPSPTIDSLKDLVNSNPESGTVIDTTLVRALAPSILDAHDSVKYVSLYLTALTFTGTVPTTLVVNGTPITLNPEDLEKTSLIIIKRALNELVYNYLLPLVKHLRDEIAIQQNLDNVRNISERLDSLLMNRPVPDSGSEIHPNANPATKVD